MSNDEKLNTIFFILHYMMRERNPIIDGYDAKEYLGVTFSEFEEIATFDTFPKPCENNYKFLFNKKWKFRELAEWKKIMM